MLAIDKVYISLQMALDCRPGLGRLSQTYGLGVAYYLLGAYAYLEKQKTIFM